MAASLEQNIVEKLRQLPTEKQREVLEFVEKITAPVEQQRMSIFEEIEKIVSEVPPEAWDEVPTDGSINVDHYLYGAPKK